METIQQYKRGDIFFADMEPHLGSEQGGCRPVVVLQNNIGNLCSPTLIVATLTSHINKKRHQPTHVLLDSNPSLGRPSIVQLEQIFTVDKQRLKYYIGCAGPDEMEAINQGIRNSLALDEKREYREEAENG